MAAKICLLFFALWSHLHKVASIMMMTSVVDIQIQELNHSAVLPDAGDVVTIMSTIGHSNISGVLPDNMTFFINDLSPYLLPSTNNAVIKITNSSGTINTFTLTVTQLLTSGYQINETLNFDEEFLMEFNLTVSELVYPQMNMTLNLTISYSGGGASFIVSEVLYPAITTASVPSPLLVLSDTSFEYTTENDITFQEIVHFNITQSVPEGQANLSIITEFQGISYSISLLDFLVDYPHQFQVHSESLTKDILSLTYNISLYNPSNSTSLDSLHFAIIGYFIGQNENEVLVTTANQFQASTEYLILYIIEPHLDIDVILEEQLYDDDAYIFVSIIIYHTYYLSELPAFNVLFVHSLPKHFKIYDIQSTHNYDITEGDEKTELVITEDVLHLKDDIHVIYHATVTTTAPDNAALNITSYLSYTNLVHMPQGLALEYPGLSGLSYFTETKQCVIKRRNIIMKLEKFSLVGSFFAGLLAGSVLAMVMCCIIKCCRKQKERSVTPEVEIISEYKLKYNIFEENKIKPNYMASFLTNSWKERHDTYEVLLAQNISFAENDIYFTAIRQLVTKAVEELLQSKLLSISGKQNLRKELHSKLKNLKSVAHKKYEKCNKELKHIIKKELTDKLQVLAQQHKQQIELIAEHCTNQELAILEDIQEIETKELESSFNVFLILRSLILKSKCITNYFMQIKETLQNTMQLPIPDHPLLVHIQQHVKDIEEQVVNHLIELKADLLTQYENEQLILMRKQLLEDEDIKWRVYLLQVSEKVINFINSNVPSIKERSAAMELLQVLNKDILRKSQDLVESLRKKEHTIAKQVMHTDSNDGVRLLSEEWKRHEENVTQLVDSTITAITKRFSNGAYNDSEVEQLLMIIKSDHKDVLNDIQRALVLRKAKLNANIENQRANMTHIQQVLQEAFDHRRKKDEETLKKLMDSNVRDKIIKEHEEDPFLLLKSFALEEIINYWIVSEKCIERRIRKTRSKWSKWQLRDSSVPPKSGEIQHLLVHDLIQSSWDSLIKAWEEGLIASDVKYHEVLKSLWSPQSIVNQDEKQPLVAPVVATPLPISTEKPVVSVAHEELLATHKEELSQIDARLEEEKSQAIKDLELRIHQKKMARKNIQEMEMPVPIQLSAGDGTMMSQWMLYKFKQAVWRVIEDIRYEKSKKEQEQQFNEHIQQIEDMYEAKKARAFEKMNNNFEAQLQRVEGPLKEEEISSIFKDLSNWKRLSIKQRKTNRTISVGGDPLAMKPRKPRFLPPIPQE